MKKPFIKKFIDFVEENNLFTKEDRMLLAVSGGIDSVVLAKLFEEAGYKKNIGIAHCNFGLRGDESQGDEAFVIDLAAQLGVPIFTQKFDTINFAAENNISTQMAARELRYKWFEEIRLQHSFKFIATAHHKNDSAETILLNLVKGTVLKGLHGILPKTKNHIIRPLLWAEKEEILQFAKTQKINYREDSSNSENKYQRNLLRNQVFPLLEKVNPEVINTMYHNAQQRLQLENWMDKKIQLLFRQLFINEGDILKCEIKALKEEEINEAVLFQMLNDFGFSYSQLSKLLGLLDDTEHKRFFSGTHTLIKERQQIIIIPGNQQSNQDVKTRISKDKKTAELAGKNFSLKLISVAEITELKNPEIAYLDVEKLKFPIKLRFWSPGDYFYPFGMTGKKKLSDFLTDIKASGLEKDHQLVLESGEEIAWIVGKRIDNRFKITNETKQVLKIETKTSRNS